jgi:hypothetical protein
MWAFAALVIALPLAGAVLASLARLAPARLFRDPV